jgi:hypothetical protein
MRKLTFSDVLAFWYKSVSFGAGLMSMSLQYEPASEPVHISVQRLSLSIRKSPRPLALLARRSPAQGYLAHKKTPTPLGLP